MNNEQAKFILQAYRPGGEDAQDPQFQEALEQARRDPELARWFANERAIDARISGKLKAAVNAPANLKAMLLAQSKIVRPTAWWRQPAWLAMSAAACLALLVTISVLWLKPKSLPLMTEYRGAMAQLVGSKLDHLDLMSHDVTEVRRWLTQTNAHGDFVLPAGLDGKPSLGCRLLDWQGHRVSLICFELANRQMAHLIVIDRSAFGDASNDSPQFAQLGEVATVSWSHGDKTYLVASKGASERDLRKLL
jgi:hypothetical protein